MLPQFIDAHVHLNTISSEKMEMAVKHNVSFLSINTNIPFFESIEKQEEVILSFRKDTQKGCSISPVSISGTGAGRILPSRQ